MSDPNRPSFLSLAFKGLRKASDKRVIAQQRPETGPLLQNPVGSQREQAALPPPENPVMQPPRRGGSMTAFAQSKKNDVVYQGKEPFLSPGTPLDPRMPEGEPPRRFQIPPGYNIQISPRSTEAISFAQLRAVSDYTIIRVIIEHVKESLKSHEWDIVPAEDQDKAESYTPDIKMLREFFEMPDRLHAWDEWLGMLLEEVLTIDALSVFKRRTRGGDLYGLDIIDGATVKVLSDSYGFEPTGVVPAYQQFIFGVPYVNMTRDDLYYLPRTRRANKYYGFGPVEQMIVTVNQGLRRELYSLAQLSDGNIPPGVGELPEEWKLEDIKAYQEYWDAVLSGDPQNRSRIRFVPRGFNYTKLHDGTDGDGMGIFSPFDEWLARILCFGVGISPMPFIKLTNRAVAQEMGDTESEGGVGALKLFIERFMNRVIKYDFKIDHLVFNWVTDRSRMQQKRVDRNVKYVNSGIFQIDEVRAEEGKDPIGMPAGYPTPTGYVTFDGSVKQEQLSIEGQKVQNQNAKNPGDPDLDQKQQFQVDRDKFHAKQQQANAKTQAQAVSASRETKTKAQKAWEKCRLEELDKWERFALARSPKMEKAVGFEPDFIDHDEASAIRFELSKAGLEKSFDDDIRHVFATRRMAQQPIKLAPAAARDAAHKVGDLRNVLTGVFSREAQRIARAQKSSGIKTIEPL